MMSRHMAAAHRLTLHNFQGTTLQCGAAYGRTFAADIMGFARQEVAPSKERLAYARRCWKRVEQTAPHSARFMRGIARGAQLPIEHVTLLTQHEEIVHQPHCTAFAVTHGPIGMNWDWDSNLFPWASLLRLDVTGSPRMATYAFPGLWAGAGINEHGMSLVWTGSGYSPRIEPVNGIPTYVIIYELLRCRTVRSAHTIRHAGSFIFFLADAAGETAVVEGMPGLLSVDRSDPTLGRANHYENRDIVRRSKQRPHTNPQTDSTCGRAQRTHELLHHHRGRITLPVAKSILTDRTGDGPWIHQFPHGRWFNALGDLTLDSLIAVPATRTLHTARGGKTPAAPTQWQRVSV